MDLTLNIIVICAITVNSIVFGYVASNTKNNKTNRSYLIFLTVIIVYTIFDCIIIQQFSLKETKDVIVKIQAGLWMSLAILFLNFIYLFLRKKKDEIFNFFIISTIVSILFTMFSDNVLIGFKDFNLGTAGETGSFFFPVLLLGILPPAVYAQYLIVSKGKIFYNTKRLIKEHEEALLTQQLRILFIGSCAIIFIICTNIILDEIFYFSNILHLSSISLSVQSIFILPALIKYNFLNQPIEKLGDELYLNSSDAVFITNQKNIIINLNKAARRLFNLKGAIENINISELFAQDFNLVSIEKNYEAKTKTGYYVTIAKNTITHGNLTIGKIVVIRDISSQKKAEKAYKHVIESSSDIIYNTDVDGIVTYINPVFEKISGYKESELMGIDINKLVTPDFQEKIKEIYFNFFNAPGENLTTEIPCKKKNGDIIWLELNTSKIRDGKRIKEFSTISRDITERKKTEFYLQESEERYRQLVETSTDMIYKTDLYGNYTYVNQVFIDNSGRTEEENLKMNCFDNVAEGYQEKVKSFYRIQLKNKTQITNYEFPAYIAHKKVIWISQICRLEQDEFGNICGHSVTARDITEKKQSEEQLLKTTNELKLAQNVAKLGSFTYDIKKNIVIWSDELYKIYGRDKKSFFPTKDTFYNKIVHPDSRDMVIKKVEEAITNKTEEFNYVHKTQTPNDEEKWFKAIIKIKYDKKNEAIRINGTSQDITELFLTRLNLEKSELRLLKAQEIAKLGFWEENHKTGKIFWSSILKNMFNIKEESIIKKGDFWTNIHPSDLEWMKTKWNKAEQEKEPYSGTFRIKLKTGEIKHLMEQAEFIKDERGNLYKTIGTVIDMTELHQYQEELRQLSSHIQTAQEEERAHIAREVHDELGQRLTSISMDLAFLKSKTNKDTEVKIKERLEALSKQAENTIKIIRKISQELRPSVLDDLGLISAIDWLKKQFDRRANINFYMDMPIEEVNINNEHATAIFRITQEALTNIMRHSKAKNVTIKMELNNSKILLQIQDDGSGININNKRKSNKTFGVFGMKERANNLGGELTIKNNFDKGTLVELTLPYKPKQTIST